LVSEQYAVSGEQEANRVSGQWAVGSEQQESNKLLVTLKHHLAASRQSRCINCSLLTAHCPLKKERQTTLAIVCLVSDGLTFEKKGPSEVGEYIPQGASLQGFLRGLVRVAVFSFDFEVNPGAADRKRKLKAGG